ncbi:methyltransferase domain-containing protein [Salarchaeum japonicum]|uniref:methyltransferase domain-containing protein n=1 Tax=Salarchaeum japonicum TaxID=555573 RepID=UPI003C755202
MLPQRLRRTFDQAKTRAKSSETLYSLVYDVVNAGEFSDLYEHEKMLADSIRIDNYAAAIHRHVSSDDVVVDLGTGTGILAILAAREGATVYAIDHSEFIEVAELVAEHNDVTDIDFRQVHSKDFSCPEPVDILLHEQMGDDLFNENLVENVLDFKERCLADDARILPGRFELFLEPVTLTDDERFPFIHELSVAGVDFGVLENHPLLDPYKSTGYERRFADASAVDGFLSTPEPILSFDLNDMENGDALSSELTASRRVDRAGVMDGLCLFFGVTFDDDTHFDTSPFHTNTSWRNRVLRTPQREYATDDEIAYTVDIDFLTNTGMWEVDVHGST